MKSTIVKEIDDHLHELMNKRDRKTVAIATNAHAAVHLIAGLLSSDPDIRRLALEEAGISDGK